MGEVLKGKLILNNVPVGASIGGSLAQKAYSPTVDLTETEQGVHIAITDVNGLHEADIYNGRYVDFSEEEKNELAEDVQDRFEYDDTPTEDSDNLMTSGGIFNAFEDAKVIERGTGAGSVKISDYDWHTQIASGNGAVSIGTNTEASGNNAFAEGDETVASGTHTHAEGYGTIASGRYQHVQGKFNIADPNSNYIHIVGCGTSNNNRANAYTLSHGGSGWYAGKVTVQSKVPTEPGDLTSKEYVDAELAKKQNSLVFDSEPSLISSNPVTSSGIWNIKHSLEADIELAGSRISSMQSDIIDLKLTKQNTLKFDDEPTENSTRILTSGAIYNAILTEHQDISGKQNVLAFDTDPAENSTNPVTSDGLYKQFNSINTALSEKANASSVPQKVSDLPNDAGYYAKPSSGIPAGDMADGIIPDLLEGYSAQTKAEIRSMIGAENGDDIIKVQDQQPTEAATKIWIPETMPQGIQVPTVEEVDQKIEAAIQENIGDISTLTEDVAALESAASDAEAWVNGTRDGEPVASTDPAYHNNAKYYAEQAMSGTPAGYADLVDDVHDIKEDMIKVSSTQPSEEINKLWVHSEANSEIQLPTYDEFNNLIKASDDQPTAEVNKLWIHTSEETETQVPTYEEFNDLIKMSSEQPTESANKIWISADSNEEIQLPTYAELTELMYGEAIREYDADYKSVPAEVSGWQDFTQVGDEIWFFSNSTNARSEKNGMIYRIDKDTFEYIGAIEHNLGRCGSVDYDPDNDALLIASGIEDDPYVYLYRSIAYWMQETTVDFSAASKIIINVSELTEDASGVCACWGERKNNGCRYLYISDECGSTWLKVDVDTVNDFYTNVCTVKWTKHCASEQVDGSGASQKLHGIRMYRGKLYASISDDPVYGAIYSVASRKIARDIIHVDGTSMSSTNNGCSVIGNDLYLGISADRVLARVNLN